MTDWTLELHHPGIAAIYRNYLFALENNLRYYLACVAFAEHTVFVGAEANSPVRASHNFPDVATSMRTLRDIDQMRRSGEFAQLARSQSIMGVLTAFGDAMSDLRTALGMPVHTIKKPVLVSIPGGGTYAVRPAALRIAHHLSHQYALTEPLSSTYSMLHINSLINLRHMFVHNQGRFSEDYRDHVTRRWQALAAGEQIIFDENDFDDALYFVTSNLRGFIGALDRRVSSSG
ncbi:hypothetical protein [Luteibacter sp. 3190]|uniref:hypothetical protein n=1 Tax=Luteibacter sp. 3190 TaxID=2817736 RepID=UPI002864934A|nr:hypothetical protein [Luteibacter sp. 3190]MDR6935702.1 hypothetical protein [Luteibacter sp. 3190]